MTSGALAEKRVLIAAALRVREPRVIGESWDPDGGQPAGERIDLSPRHAINNARFARVALQHFT